MFLVSMSVPWQVKAGPCPSCVWTGVGCSSREAGGAGLRTIKGDSTKPWRPLAVAHPQHRRGFDHGAPLGHIPVPVIRDGGIFSNQARFLASGVLLILHFRLTGFPDALILPWLWSPGTHPAADHAARRTASLGGGQQVDPALPRREDLGIGDTVVGHVENGGGSIWARRRRLNQGS